MSLSYEDEGRGFPVVFLHAFPMDGTMWSNNAARLRKAGYRTIVPDLPGFGNSEGKIHSIPETAAEVAHTLGKAGVRKAVICGLSMGGYVAFELYSQSPELFAAAILCDTTSEADTPEKRESRIAAIKEIESNGTRGFMDTLAETMISTHTFEARAPVVLDLRERFESAGSEAVRAALLAMANRKSSTGMLGNFRFPVLLLYGGDDPMLDDGKMMSAKIPSSELKIIEKAGHFSNLEAPVNFDAAVSDFLGTVELE